MNEVIKAIRETEFSVNDRGWIETYEGYEIETDQQVIKMYISADQQCCENWGYFWSNDDTEPFVGARLTGLSVVDKQLDTVSVDKRRSEHDAMFVNLETDQGVLQFTIYNEHNGYYSHEIVIESEQLSEKRYM